MQLNLSELFVVDGMVKEYQVELEMTTFEWSKKQYPLTNVKPVTLRITHLKDRNLVITGMVDLHMLIPCDRCLEPVDIPFLLAIEKTVDVNKSEEERIEEMDEQPYMNGYYLDVDRLVYEELVVNIPMKVLCDEECKGICNRCGANLNVETCDCDVTELDPRMSVIRDIFNKANK